MQKIGRPRKGTSGTYAWKTKTIEELLAWYERKLTKDRRGYRRKRGKPVNAPLTRKSTRKHRTEDELREMYRKLLEKSNDRRKRKALADSYQ